MGAVVSGHLKRVISRYNASSRALKAIEKDKLPTAPSFFKPAIEKEKILENNPELKKELEALKEKDINLDEYLKKVYLTSTSKNFQFVSKKPLPTKQIRTQPIVMTDIECSPGCCTLEDISQMMVMYREDSKKWNATALAEKFQIDKNSVVNILIYYSFFKKEEFDFINEAPDTSKEPEKIEFETFTQLEKKPVKLIEGKKEIESRKEERRNQ